MSNLWEASLTKELSKKIQNYCENTDDIRAFRMIRPFNLPFLTSDRFGYPYFKR